MSVNVVLKLLSATKSQGLTADVMLNLFVPCFSDEGSNKRAVEEDIMHNFCTQLNKCKDGAAPFTCSNILIFRTSASQFHPLASSLCQPLPFRQKQGYSLCLPALMSFEYHTACRSTLKYLICPLWGVRVLAIYSLLQPVTQQVALASLFECACVLAGTGIILILYLNKQKLAACVD